MKTVTITEAAKYLPTHYFPHIKTMSVNQRLGRGETRESAYKCLLDYEGVFLEDRNKKLSELKYEENIIEGDDKILIPEYSDIIYKASWGADKCNIETIKVELNMSDIYIRHPKEHEVNKKTLMIHFYPHSISYDLDKDSGMLGDERSRCAYFITEQYAKDFLKHKVEANITSLQSDLKKMDSK